MQFERSSFARSAGALHDLCIQTGPARSQAEHFIAERFHALHGARVQHFMPVLLGLRDAGDVLLAACGLRGGAAGELFLESYLRRPVEHALSSALNEAVERDRIVEVGNLAVALPATAREFIAALTRFLVASPYEWVVFTGVTALRNAFRRLGIALIDLGPAVLDALPPGMQDDWGDYYRGGPRVCAVSVHGAAQAIAQCCVEAA